MPYLPARRGPDGDTIAAAGEIEQRLRVRPQVQAGVDEVPRGGLARDRLLVLQQPHDDIETFLEQRPRLRRVEPEHERVGRQRTGTHTEHEPPAGEVVEEDGPLGDHERVVVGDADHACAELDVAGPLGGDGDEDLG